MSESNYGVSYQLPAPRPATTIQKLQGNGIRYVRIQWTDLAGVASFRIIPFTHFAKILDSPRPSVGIAKAVLGLVFHSLAGGFSAIGEYLYVPDLTSARVLPYAPGHVSVMGFFEEKIPVPDPLGDITLKVSLCPRTTLQRVVDDAKATSALSFLVGFETEFVLLKLDSATHVLIDNPIEAANKHGYCVSAALLAGSKEAACLEEIAGALNSSGVDLQMYHAELAPGQYEIVTGPLPPLEAVDALIHTRQIILNVANKHSFRATFAPRIWKNNAGNATHVHISLHSPQTPKDAPAGTPLSPHERSFLSGVLAHLPALCALTLPLRSSYDRMIDGVWSGGTYVSWGTDNKEAPVRLCGATSPSSRNFEVKCLDGTANFYLAIAGIIGAGARAVRDQKALEMGDCNGAPAATLSEDERRALGIVNRMSTTLMEARKALKADVELGQILGKELVEAYLSVNRSLATAMMDDAEYGGTKALVENF